MLSPGSGVILDFVSIPDLCLLPYFYMNEFLLKRLAVYVNEIRN